MDPALVTHPNPELSSWFTEEVLPHEEALRNWLRSRFPSLHDRDDLIQDVYIRVWKARIAGPVPCPKALLFTAARNLALNRLRHQSIVSQLGEKGASSVYEDTPATPEQVSRREDHAFLTQALQSLPDRCREVFILRRIYGLSQKAIAARLNVTEKTVENHCLIGMRKLSEYFHAVNAVPAARRSAPILPLARMGEPVPHA
jgi:RNA polymerase sigma factor (sigma-70 family)